MTERSAIDRRPAILCTGIAVQDIVMQVDHFPPPGMKVAASDYITTGGGCSANSAVAIARLGGRVQFAGPLGDATDKVSRDIVAWLEREHVGCADVVRVPGATASVSLILIDAVGEKMIATRRGRGLEQARPADPARMVAAVDAVLADNRFPEFVLPLCRAARTRGLPVVIDLDRQTDINDALLATGTHVIASSEGLRGTTGVDDPRGGLARLGTALAGFLAVTDGPNGMYWLDGGNVRHMPAFHVAAIDTLGAGDAFHGAFVHALVSGRDELAAMRFAAAAAAIKCTRFGGTTGTPSLAEVEALLANAG